MTLAYLLAFQGLHGIDILPYMPTCHLFDYFELSGCLLLHWIRLEPTKRFEKAVDVRLCDASCGNLRRLEIAEDLRACLWSDPIVSQEAPLVDLCTPILLAASETRQVKTDHKKIGRG